MSYNQPRLRFDTVLIRFAGEIGIKALWTRKLYERRLIHNIKASLKHYHIPYEALDRSFGRLYLKTSETECVSQLLAKVFGVSSLSSALETTSQPEEIIDASVRVASFKLKEAQSFAVRCRRIGKHPYSSQDICRQVGRRIQDAYPHLDLSVDLKHPDVTLGIEVRENRAFQFADVIKGPGGLPLGTQPKLVCLLTDDLNSAVACWLTMKRGCPPVFVHFDNSPFIKPSSLDSTLNYAQALSQWATGSSTRLRVISNGKNLAKIFESCPSISTGLFCKRLMLRVAERIAKFEKAEGIVTGETLDAKFGPTLNQFRIEDEVLKDYFVYRPLQVFDETEIMRLAGKIGITELTDSKVGKRGISRKRSCGPSLNFEDLKRAEELLLDVDEMVEASMNSMVYKEL